MNELPKIYEQDGKKAVSAKELHSFIEMETRFDIWIKRMLDYGFIENVDYQCLYKNVQMPNGGHKEALDDYVLSLNCAKEIAMIQKNERGKEVRQYFIACEEKAKQKPLNQFEIMQQSLNILIEHDKRLNSVESKVNSIIERQIEAEKELKMLPLSTETVPEMTLRKKCIMLVNRYSEATGTYHQIAWDIVYQKLYYHYNISIKNCQKQKNESWLDVADKKGHIDKIYAIISNLLKERGIAA